MTRAVPSPPETWCRSLGAEKRVLAIWPGQERQRLKTCLRIMFIK